jgi:hypothetical protein
MQRFSNEGQRTGDQQAAYAASAWLRRADRDGSLSAFFQPGLEPDERALAQVEGWILGVILFSLLDAFVKVPTFQW